MWINVLTDSVERQPISWNGNPTLRSRPFQPPQAAPEGCGDTPRVSNKCYDVCVCFKFFNSESGGLIKSERRGSQSHRTRNTQFCQIYAIQAQILRKGLITVYINLYISTILPFLQFCATIHTIFAQILRSLACAGRFNKNASHTNQQ